MIGLIEPVPLLLIHGTADRTVPIRDGRRLARLAGPAATHWEVPGAGHGQTRRAAPEEWDARVSSFLRLAFSGGREAMPIIPTSGAPTPDSASRTLEGD